MIYLYDFLYETKELNTSNIQTKNYYYFFFNVQLYCNIEIKQLLVIVTRTVTVASMAQISFLLF